jgi:hypothetical protein
MARGVKPSRKATRKKAGKKKRAKKKVVRKKTAAKKAVRKVRKKKTRKAAGGPARRKAGMKTVRRGVKKTARKKAAGKKAGRRKAGRKKVVARKRATGRGKPKLEDVITTLIRKSGKPLAFQDMLATIRKKKLVTTKSKNFANVLRRTLSTSKRIKRVGRGIYDIAA